MILDDVIKEYGKAIADKMRTSKYLQGITMTVVRKSDLSKAETYEEAIKLMREGKAAYDIPFRDIDNAYRDISGLKVHVT